MSQPFQRKENQSFTSDNSQIDEKGPFPSTVLEKEYCELFQQKLDAQYINTIWVRFSEKSGTNETKGKKLLTRKYFTNELQQQLKEDRIIQSPQENQILAKDLVDALFQRFKHEDNENIDIQDLMVAFTILSRMKDDQKLKEIFKLTDIDGDDCLSIEDIHQMIRRIERVFCKEMVHIKNDSSYLLNELALIQAERKFAQTVFRMGKESNNEGLDADEDKFISWAEFYESLLSKPNLKAKFLPNNFQLAAVLQNVSSEKTYMVSDQDDLQEFRRLMHIQLRKHYGIRDYRTFMTPHNKYIPLPGDLRQDFDQIEWSKEFNKVQQREKEEKQLQTNQQQTQMMKKYQKEKDNKPPPEFEKCNPIINWQGYRRLQDSLNDKKQQICSKKSDSLLDMVEKEKNREKQGLDKHDSNKLYIYQKIVKEMAEEAQRQEFARDKRKQDISHNNKDQYHK